MTPSFRTKVLPVEQPAGTFYIGAVNVNDVLKICRPFYKPAPSGPLSRDLSQVVKLDANQVVSLLKSLDSEKFKRTATDLIEEPPSEQYQRFVDGKRAKEIAKYLEQPTSLLPNSIILAISLDYEESDVIREKDGDLEVVLPVGEDSAVILDGQHRIESFRYLPDEVRTKMNVVITFLVGIPFYEQAEIFAVINGRQKPVNRSIIFDLFGYAPPGGKNDEKLYDGLMAVSRFCSHVTRLLNRVDLSPWQAKIKMRGPGDVGVISQAAVVEYLSALVEPKKFTTRLRVYPLLFSFFKDGNPAGCAAVLILYLRAIQAALPADFANPKSLLWKNNGVAVIIRILHDDIILAGGISDLMNSYARIVARWKRAPRADIETPPKTGGGGIQNDLYARLRASLFTAAEGDELEKAGARIKKMMTDTGGLIE